MTEAVKWNKCEEWKTSVCAGRKQVAGVKVVRWSFRTEDDPKLDEYDRLHTGTNCWNVYAYIYPEHPLFEKLSAHTSGDNSESYGLTSSMPLHGGQTYFALNYGADNKVESVQVGCDYMHSWDDRFNGYATREEAPEVFSDAEELHAWLLGPWTEQA